MSFPNQHADTPLADDLYELASTANRRAACRSVLLANGLDAMAQRLFQLSSQVAALERACAAMATDHDPETNLESHCMGDVAPPPTGAALWLANFRAAWGLTAS